MRVGDRALTLATLGPAEVEAYIALGGAPPTPGLAPEALVGAVLSRLLGTRLPGPGANYLKQDTRYLAAPRLGEQLRFEVEITRLRTDKSLVDLRTACTGADGRLVAEGRALIFVGDHCEPLVPALELQEDTRP